MGEKGDGLSGTRIKGTWTKSKRGRTKGGDGDEGGGGSREGKWRELYLNNNKKFLNKDVYIFKTYIKNFIF